MHIAALFECDFHDSAGRLVARDVIPLVVEFDRLVRLRPRDVRHVATAVASCERVRQQVSTAVSRRESLLASETAATGAAVMHRLEGVLGVLDGPRRTLIQQSLFDKRAEQQARASNAAIAGIRGHLERRLTAARALQVISASTPRLVAVWPFSSR